MTSKEEAGDLQDIIQERMETRVGVGSNDSGILWSYKSRVARV